MLELKNEMLLYHGSYVEVENPELAKCAAYKDFGRGFYLTTSKEQAESFSKLSTSKAITRKQISRSQDHGIVSSFILKNSEILKTLIYETAERDWLHCVVGHRKKATFDSIVKELGQYDVIGGKIANDATNTTIEAYMTGLYGEIGSKEADDICIRLLLPNRLENQFCFRSDAALSCLEFIGSEKIWMKK